MVKCCLNCYYYCLSNVFNHHIDGPVYDFDHKVCGIHGCSEITDPTTTLVITNYHKDTEITCQFRNKIEDLDSKYIQLSLF